MKALSCWLPMTKVTASGVEHRVVLNELKDLAKISHDNLASPKMISAMTHW